MATRPTAGVLATRTPMILSLVKLLMLGIANLPFLRAAPTRYPHFATFGEADDGSLPADSPTLWIYMAVAVGLVLLGGAFAGLTIALMGQDEIYLQVIRTSGDGSEKKHAARVLRLLKRGKHWVLVTLLLGNVITNETLPIILDRSLGGGWPAVLGSTVLIVIFGEIIPQSICVRYGLPIGAWMSPLVLILMYILGPVAWPTAKLLDYLLGEDHGTTYKKAGLKTLVTLHKTLGSAGEQLNSDEVTIISAVLDLKEKSVGSIMTPIDDVFTMSADTILDEKTMDIILSAGYSRIPIHNPDNPSNFVGMLLVKILITYDPEDCKAVRDFALATLPETSPSTSCLDIVNFFQEGKSHMVLVSEHPAQDYGVLGVVTLEDVIEELIGEEIVDESDVYVDVHKKFRRNAPAPRYRISKGEVVTNPKDSIANGEEDLIDISNDQAPAHDAVRKLATAQVQRENRRSVDLSSSPKASLMPRRTSSITGMTDRDASNRSIAPEIREHFKHLGPSNLASRPRQTRYNTVKIKPGGGSLVDGVTKRQNGTETTMTVSAPAPQGGVGEGLISSGGKDAKDGVQAVQAGHGSMDGPNIGPKSPVLSNKAIQINSDAFDSNQSDPKRPQNNRQESTQSHSTVGSLPRENRPRSRAEQSRSTRSGSITENIIYSNGIKKIVLETTSSSEDNNDKGAEGQKGAENDDPKESGTQETETESKGGKRKRRRRRKTAGTEETPLLERYED